MNTVLKFMLTCCFAITFSVFAQQNNMGGGGVDVNQDFPCLTDGDRAKIKAELALKISELQTAGILPQKFTGTQPKFIWPVMPSANSTDYNVYGISNFVDQNASFPNQLQDYNCGERTYDLSSGYNHQGIDVFSWPFGWYKMDNDLVEIVAGAPGKILNKIDGNNDRSCGFGGGNWNAVYIMHDDGSIAWYGHMKRNSLTTKAVGDSVIAGEFLGVMGSSGNSTGPHLHLEIYDTNGNLIEPYQGTCNGMNTDSWWVDQKPYYEPQLNAIMTHSDAPVFPACPQQEILNLSNEFSHGDTVYTVFYYRDQLLGQITNFRIIRPNGINWIQWDHSSPAEHYSASYWYWFWTLPNTLEPGLYTLEATFNNEVYTHNFTLTPPTGIEDESIEIANAYKLHQNYPNPFNPSTEITYYLPKSDDTNLTIYNSLGQEIRILENTSKTAGNHTVVWDGKNELGESVPAGAYFYRLTAGNFQETKQMLLVK